jgi:UDP-N-acetylglucosamine--N-acetylmuramyl-(pentapeptide) pyrophosphoryl-undecaprenol N-acetylglucosamine transferase
MNLIITRRADPLRTSEARTRDPNQNRSVWGRPMRDGTLLLVATTGGHLVQLHELADRLPDFRGRLWVTFPGEQAQSLLARERVVFVPEITERDMRGVLRTLPTAHRLFTAEQPSAVVSTGSAIALAFLPYASLRGIPAYYIESAARTGAPSLTGRMLATLPGIQLYRQYESRATGRWRYGGSVFDGFVPEDGPARPVRRVLVTLGTMPQSFRRLLERLVAILPPQVDVFWQTGGTPTEGLGITAMPFVPAATLETTMRDADAVVAHAGCGSALTALKLGKCPILVPRDPHGQEIVDAHQTEIAAQLDSRGLALWRRPDTLSFTDIEGVASRKVRRTAAPPPFQLAGFS